MKVLMLSWEYTPHIVGGLGKHVVEIVPELVAAGVEVHLVVPNLSNGTFNEPLLLPDGSPATNGSQVYRVNASGMQGDFFSNTWHDNILVTEFGNHLIRHEGGFDLIHDHDWLSGFAGIALKREHHIPLVATIHATEMGRNRGNLYGEMQRSIHQAEWWLTYEAWGIITCSQYMAWEVMNYFGAPAAKVDVIPNGVDTRRFDALQGMDLSAFRLAWARPDQPIVYYVGRMVPEKGLSVIIDSVPHVLKDWPGVKFVLAGGGGYANDLRKQAWDLG
ncbi:MAG: glycosyltransferase family 4 protein, partial [Chloroflexia bacterium]